MNSWEASDISAHTAAQAKALIAEIVLRVDSPAERIALACALERSAHDWADTALTEYVVDQGWNRSYPQHAINVVSTLTGYAMSTITRFFHKIHHEGALVRSGRRPSGLPRVEEEAARATRAAAADVRRDRPAGPVGLPAGVDRGSDGVPGLPDHTSQLRPTSTPWRISTPHACLLCPNVIETGDVAYVMLLDGRSEGWAHERCVPQTS